MTVTRFSFPDPTNPARRVPYTVERRGTVCHGTCGLCGHRTARYDWLGAVVVAAHNHACEHIEAGHCHTIAAAEHVVNLAATRAHEWFI